MFIMGHKFQWPDDGLKYELADYKNLSTDHFNNQHIFKYLAEFTCNPVTLEAEFRVGVDSIPVEGKCPSIDGWTVWPPVIQHKERSLAKYWDPAET